MSLQGHVAFVTGATGALGHAVTAAFLDKGATVVASFRTAESLDQLRRRIGEPAARLSGVEVDLSSGERIQQAVAEVLHRAGRIDSLVNLVGGYAGGQPVQQMEEALWSHMLSLNLTSAFLITQAVLPHLLANKRGRIVHVSSRSAVEPFAGAAAYVASKAGLIAFTRAVAAEVAGSGVTVNVVVPGTIDTPANRSSMPRANFSKWVPPQAIAEAILFLASEEAGAINGAALPIFGSG